MTKEKLMMKNETIIKKQVQTRIPTAYGDFDLVLYTSNQDEKEHLVFMMGHVDQAEAPLVRLHSECFTGDVIGSLRCDCGEQLDLAMQKVADEGVGAILYLRQEGRGIGLVQKLRAYNLQDGGYDTVDANILLGHAADERDYTIAFKILTDLGVSSLRLMTNNPDKIQSLLDMGIRVKERVPLQPHAHPENTHYLLTKAQRMDHMLNLSTLIGTGPSPNLPSSNGNGNH